MNATLQNEKMTIANSSNALMLVVLEPCATLRDVPAGSSMTVENQGPEPGRAARSEEDGLVVIDAWPSSTIRTWIGGKMVYETDNAVPAVPPGMPR